MKPTIVITRKQGRWGNQLGLFANFIAFSLEYQVPVLNPAFFEYAHYFGTTAGGLLCRFPHRPGRLASPKWIRVLNYRLLRQGVLWYRKLPCHIPGVALVALETGEPYELDSPAFLELVDTRRLILVQGYAFRANALVKKHAREIRAFFRPLPRYTDPVQFWIKQIRSRCDILVGVHIRQTDYRTFDGGRYFYETPVYAGWMSRLQAMLADRQVGFMVCSDTVQDMSLFDGLAVYPGPGDAFGDWYKTSYPICVFSYDIRGRAMPLATGTPCRNAITYWGLPVHFRGGRRFTARYPFVWFQMRKPHLNWRISMLRHPRKVRQERISGGPVQTHGAAVYPG